MIALLVALLAAQATPCGPADALVNGARLGKLTDAERTCVEAQLPVVTDIAARDALSHTSMALAWNSGNLGHWLTKVERHLADVDPEDAATWLRLAKYQQSKKQYEAALESAARAERAAFRFAPEDRTSAMIELAQVQAEAAHGAYAAAGDDQRLAVRWRVKAQLFAVTWMVRLTAAGQQPSAARALCAKSGMTAEQCDERAAALAPTR